MSTLLQRAWITVPCDVAEFLCGSPLISLLGLLEWKDSGDLEEKNLQCDERCIHDRKVVLSFLGRCLQLPERCRIFAVNTFYRFSRSEIRLLVESPEFCPILIGEGREIPEFRVVYSYQKGSKPAFAYFEGKAVDQPQAAANSFPTASDVLLPCWRCGIATSRCIMGGAAECEACSHRLLF